jgi:hypothetical protein
MQKSNNKNLLSSRDCSLKVISTKKISGKLNVTVRLIKTPPASTSKIFSEFSNQLIADSHKRTEKKNCIDPSDFIEPVPSFQEYMSNDEYLENELCDTLPILPRALRNTIKRKLNRHKNILSPPKQKNNFVRFKK